MMETISLRLNCSNQLVLLAFEECPGKENDRYDFMNWCSKNMDKDVLDVDSENEGSVSDSDSWASSDSEESIIEDKHFQYSSSRFLFSC
jgi:hypothetical protein